MTQILGTFLALAAVGIEIAAILLANATGRAAAEDAHADPIHPDTVVVTGAALTLGALGLSIAFWLAAFLVIGRGL
jgi:hypothetical protein